MMSFSVRLFLFFLVCLIASACSSVPAQPPPQLQDTPGPFVVLGDKTVQTPSYRVDAPEGWKIVKNSEATDPVTLVFASPDDSMTIWVSEELLPAAPSDDAVVSQDAHVTLANGQSVYLVGQGKRELKTQFEEIFAAVQTSVRPPQ